MRHLVKSKRLNRAKPHRDSLLTNMAVSVILYEHVETTEAKAKFVKPFVEKLITIAKTKDPVTAMRQLTQLLPDEKAAQKLVRELKTRYAQRSSGFTRVIRLGFRPSDAARKAFIELV
ncbi:MAG: 50S ribosomal protein L17 [Candidatus Peregrinibacteria bacterium]